MQNTIQKDAGVAAVLNTILPGLGWIYREKIAAGIVSIIIDALLLYGCLFAVTYSSYSSHIEDYRALFQFLYFIYWIFQINYVYNVKSTNAFFKGFLNEVAEEAQSVPNARARQALRPHNNKQPNSRKVQE